MATKKTKFTLKREEFHQVQVTYNLEISLSDQAAWTQLRDFAIETSEIDEDDFPVKATKHVEDWQLLYMKAGDRVKEVSEQLADRWLSEEQGTTEYQYTVTNEVGRFACDAILFP